MSKRMNVILKLKRLPRFKGTPQFEIFCDSSYNYNNPGTGTISFVVYTRTNNTWYLLESVSKSINMSSHNVGEHLAVLEALNYCYRNNLHKGVIYSDSELTCKHVSGEYNISSKFIPIVMEIQSLLNTTQSKVLWLPRNKNKLAHSIAYNNNHDQEVNTMDSNVYSDIECPECHTVQDFTPVEDLEGLIECPNCGYLINTYDF